MGKFYLLIDALVTWIPGLRIWEWEGTVYHERTGYLHVVEFYFIWPLRYCHAL
jgi:phosphatidylserine decarboxylase